MSYEWEQAHSAVHDLLCGQETYQTILVRIKDMMLRYLCSVTQASTVHEQFVHRPIAFKDLKLHTQYFLIQVVHLLGIQSVVDHLYDLITQTAEQHTQISWKGVLALTSTIAVTARGGIAVLKALIRKLLVFTFRPALASEHDQLTTDALDQLPAETSSGHENRTSVSSNPLSDWDRFCLALLLARQLSAEDVRLTGFTYTQWWAETFCSSSTTSEKPVLASRADVALMIEFIIQLLPWESDPRALQIQLSHKPTWTSPSFGTKKYSHLIPVDSAEDPLLLDTELALAELESIDAQTRDCCLQRWNDYVAIARGRVAELRESNPEQVVPDVPTSIGKIADSSMESTPTPGWNEVCAWFDEIHQQLIADSSGITRTTIGSSNTTSTTVRLRIPQSFTEANLFQPRKLRTVLIPALLKAPELGRLSESQQTAREHLFTLIRQSGLGHLLDPNNEVYSRPENKRVRSYWTKSTGISPVSSRTRRGASFKRVSARSRSARSMRRLR